MKKSNLLLVFAVLVCFIYSCKKSNSSLTDLTGQTWKMTSTYDGYLPFNLYLKYLSTGIFLADTTSNPTLSGGTWSQSGNSIKFDFYPGYHYKGNLTTASNMSGTMVDSVAMVPGTWTSVKQ